MTAIKDFQNQKENLQNAAEEAIDKGRNMVQTAKDAVMEQKDKAMSFANRKIEEGTEYFEKRGVRGIMDDVAGVIRNHPLPALLAGLTLGCLLGRLLPRK